MAATFQGLGAATALSLSGSFDSKRLHLLSRRSLSGRKTNFLVVRSDGRIVSSSMPARRSQQFIANAVATKADQAAASTASKS
ncbi:hypothetical protein CRG98_048473, partial [Punica granatum]